MNGSIFVKCVYHFSLSLYIPTINKHINASPKRKWSPKIKEFVLLGMTQVYYTVLKANISKRVNRSRAGVPKKANIYIYIFRFKDTPHSICVYIYVYNGGMTPWARVCVYIYIYLYNRLSSSLLSLLETS